jgi:hypothetical protein
MLSTTGGRVRKPAVGVQAEGPELALHRCQLEQASSSWGVALWEPQTKRMQYIESYASEEDAARAYDCAAVQAHGPGAKRNFPDEDFSELPVTVGEERKQRSCGTHGRSSSTLGPLPPARAYDCVVVRARFG